MAERWRTFVALRVGPAPAGGLAALGAGLAASCPALRLVARRDLHVTLHFLGATDPAHVPRIGAALCEVAAAHPPLLLAYAGLGAFPTPRRPRVLWAGVAPLPDAPQGADALARLAAAVGRALAPLGHPPEARAFHGHVTLARLDRPPTPALLARLEAARAAPAEPLGAETVSDLELILSEPGRRPYHYRTLTKARLAAGPAHGGSEGHGP